MEIYFNKSNMHLSIYVFYYTGKPFLFNYLIEYLLLSTMVLLYIFGNFISSEVRGERGCSSRAPGSHVDPDCERLPSRFTVPMDHDEMRAIVTNIVID